jgi:predicted PurR-regulated permease PerM
MLIALALLWVKAVVLLTLLNFVCNFIQALGRGGK